MKYGWHRMPWSWLLQGPSQFSYRVVLKVYGKGTRAVPWHRVVVLQSSASLSEFETTLFSDLDLIFSQQVDISDCFSNALFPVTRIEFAFRSFHQQTFLTLPFVGFTQAASLLPLGISFCWSLQLLPEPSFGSNCEDYTKDSFSTDFDHLSCGILWEISPVAYDWF